MASTFVCLLCALGKLDEATSDVIAARGVIGALPRTHPHVHTEFVCLSLCLSACFLSLSSLPIHDACNICRPVCCILLSCVADLNAAGDEKEAELENLRAKVTSLESQLTAQSNGPAATIRTQMEAMAVQIAGNAIVFILCYLWYLFYSVSVSPVLFLRAVSLFISRTPSRSLAAQRRRSKSSSSECSPPTQTGS